MNDLYSIFQGGYTANKWRLLGEYLKGREISAGEGIRVDDSSSSGTIISAAPKREVRQSQAPPFSVLSIRKDTEQEGGYLVSLQEGWVIERETRQTADAIQFHQVDLDGEPMSTRPRREAIMTPGDFAVCYYTTDEEGFVTGTPEISIVATVEDSLHHQPPSGEGSGAGGYYYIKLFKLEADNGGVKIVYYQQSDIEHTRLPTFRNVGGERYIHKEWESDDDRYDFRTLKQFEPTGEGTIPPYGKVIVDAVGEEFDDANDAIKFSAISEHIEGEIEVDDDGAGTITVRGNSKSGSLYWEYCEEDDEGNLGETLLTWSDGLITNTNPNASFKAGCAGLPTGYNGDILYHNGTDWVVLTNPGINVNGEGWVLAHSGVFPEWLPYDGNSF